MRRALLCSAAVIAIGWSGAAFAGEAADTDEVVVTGSRIVRNGFDTPTPVTVANIEQIQQTTPSNIPDALNQLPIFNGSRSQYPASLSGTSPGAGNYLNLRNVGLSRSLILLDGRRVPPTSFEGTVDANTLPQLLVSQVEVVTGGASAVYGSDAVSGVINFVLDKRFTGFKGVVQGGISSRGDANSYKVALAGGMSFLDDRAHVVFSAEHYQHDGVKTNEDRPYGPELYAIAGAGTRAAPFRVISNGRISNGTWGGAVLTGPLANQRFTPQGTLVPFDRGVASGTTNLSIGGDGAYFRNRTLAAPLRTESLFARGQYELGASVTAFVQLGFNEARNRYKKALDTRPAGTQNSITIFSGNAFLQPAVQSILTTTNTPNFVLSRFGSEEPLPVIDMLTNSWQVVGGLEGRVFNDWKWEAYVEHGVGRLREATLFNTNNRRYYAAVDAVRDPSGNIVCRVTLTNPGLYPGCVPYNPLGEGAPSAAAIAYVLGTTQFDARNTMTDVAGNLTGELFSTWAGPISFAVGGEYRVQKLLLEGNSNPSSGVDFTGLRGGFTINTTEYSRPAVANSKGKTSVWEINAETLIPLAKDLPFAKSAELSAAVRHTHYSTSGGVQTWKLGLSWEPISDLRFRATKSRDIRAPSVYDLYAGEQFVQPAFLDAHTNTNGFPLSSSVGNPGLVPEVAKTFTAGVIYRPEWLSGFSVSLDYYDISIKDGIGTVGGATMNAQCETSNGTSIFCANIIRPLPFSDRTPANFPTRILNRNLNLAQVYTHGLDLEVGYNTELERLVSSLPGRVDFRLLASHQPVLKSRAFDGATIINTAGTPGLSALRMTFTGGYTLGPFSTNVQIRYQNRQKWTGDPTVFYAEPALKTYTIVALNFGYKFKVRGANLDAFLTINNLFDVNPPIFPANAAILGAGYPATGSVDVVGRYFTSGVRFAF